MRQGPSGINTSLLDPGGRLAAYIRLLGSRKHRKLPIPPPGKPQARSQNDQQDADHHASPEPAQATKGTGKTAVDPWHEISTPSSTRAPPEMKMPAKPNPSTVYSRGDRAVGVWVDSRRRESPSGLTGHTPTPPTPHLVRRPGQAKQTKGARRITSDPRLWQFASHTNTHYAKRKGTRATITKALGAASPATPIIWTQPNHFLRKHTTV